MNTAKFKKGDKVKFVKLLIHDKEVFYIGQIGEIRNVCDREWDQDPYKVVYDAVFKVKIGGKLRKCPQTCYEEELARAGFTVENA